jgi:hypothetical protein
MRTQINGKNCGVNLVHSFLQVIWGTFFFPSKDISYSMKSLFVVPVTFSRHFVWQTLIVEEYGIQKPTTETHIPAGDFAQWWLTTAINFRPETTVP